MSQVCEFCGKLFISKSNLSFHIKTAKYCIKIQNEGKDDTENVGVNCEFCKKSFSTVYNLQEHHRKCKKKEIKEKIKESEKYEKKSREKLKETLKKEYEKKLEDKLEIQKKEYEEKLERQKREYEEKLERQQNVINTIAMNPSNTKNTINEDEEKDQPPLNIYQQLNQVANTIEPEQEKEEIIISSITINSITITSRHLDHYVNATELCQAGGKKFNHWYSLDTTKELIKVLESDTGIPASLLVEAKRGQTSKFKQGSWIHPDLAIQLAQWISPSFALQVSRWVKSLFNEGTVIIDLHLLKQQQEELKAKDQRIKQLENVCLTKRKRVEYPEQNVIYLLTTEDHLKRHTYIIGKAKNLTNRLSTYNKTCDHTVVHYRSCKNEEDMTTVESLVISRLRDFKEQANRDRFVLPETKDISFFIKTIDQCVEFLN